MTKTVLAAAEPSASGMNRSQISGSLGGSLPAIAGILLIVAAGGGFKQTLVDAGVGTVVADWAKDANISALVLGWLVAVGIRLATGSATVATITAAGIVAPLAEGLDGPAWRCSCSRSGPARWWASPGSSCWTCSSSPVALCLRRRWRGGRERLDIGGVIRAAHPPAD